MAAVVRPPSATAGLLAGIVAQYRAERQQVAIAVQYNAAIHPGHRFQHRRLQFQDALMPQQIMHLILRIRRLRADAGE